MPRPRKDGTAARAVNKRKLTPLFVTKARPQPSTYLVWDTEQRGLALAVRPSGHKAFTVIYTHHHRPRWYHLGDAQAVGLSGARKLAREVMIKVAGGADPQADRKAERSAGTFEELANRYRDEHAKVHNKSWKQAAALVQKHLLPRLGKLTAVSISRADIKGVLARIATTPVVANQVLASASAIFTWAIKERIVDANPCRLIARHETQSRDRVLADSEIAKFWRAFDSVEPVVGTALKLILLTGQRPGEVCHMRREHLIDGWWTMPGKPVPAIQWPGTKNSSSHRVWLSEPAQKLIKEMEGDGFVMTGPRGNAVGGLDATMREICAKLGVDRATPHDLRRTCLTKVTGLKFGRDAMDRIANHKEKGKVTDVYDRHEYGPDDQKIMETVAAHIVSLVEGTSTDNVLTFQRK